MHSLDAGVGHSTLCNKQQRNWLALSWEEIKREKQTHSPHDAKMKSEYHHHNYRLERDSREITRMLPKEVTTQMVGFEPTLQDGNWFRVSRLNHSATSAKTAFTWNYHFIHGSYRNTWISSVPYCIERRVLTRNRIEHPTSGLWTPLKPTELRDSITSGETSQHMKDKSNNI